MSVLASFRNIFRIPELRRRILGTLGLLVVFRIGAHIPLPGLDAEAVRKFAEDAARSMGGFWNLLQMLSGGAVGHLALFSMGIAPYITASIVIQLLTRISATLEALSKDGPRGQKKLRQITILATLPVCLLQASIAVSRLSPVLVSPGIGNAILVVAGLTAGSFFLVWIGEQITERGLGNGASVLIMAGIVARMPALVREMIRREPGADVLLLILAFHLAAVVATVFISQAQRRIPLQHASHVRGRRFQLGGRHYLPLRVLTAGVMPIIFASSALVLPELFGAIPGMDWIARPFRHAGFALTAFYAAAILFLSYFWTYVYFSPSEIANQLRENGSFIPGIRPGERTAEYLDGILSRITLVGAACLAAIALLPGFVARALGMEHLLEAFLGGSGLLIVVGVVLDLLRKLEASLLMHHYGGFLDRK
jgi:preprotein translocase subunit SecY